jgi:hypothetical protein
MKKTLSLAGALMLAFATGAVAQNSNNGNSAHAPGKDRVCLLTFNDADNMEAGADADIVRAQWLPRQAAESQANQHPERVLGEQFGPQWTEQLCNQFANGNRS